MNAREAIEKFLIAWRDKHVSAMEAACDPLWAKKLNLNALGTDKPTSSEFLTMTFMGDPITSYEIIKEMNPYPAYAVFNGKRITIDKTMVRDFLMRLYFKDNPNGLRFKMRVVFSKSAHEFRVHPESLGRNDV